MALTARALARASRCCVLRIAPPELLKAPLPPLSASQKLVILRTARGVRDAAFNVSMAAARLAADVHHLGACVFFYCRIDEYLFEPKAPGVSRVTLDQIRPQPSGFLALRLSPRMPQPSGFLAPRPSPPNNFARRGRALGA